MVWLTRWEWPADGMIGRRGKWWRANHDKLDRISQVSLDLAIHFVESMLSTQCTRKKEIIGSSAKFMY